MSRSRVSPLRNDAAPAEGADAGAVLGDAMEIDEVLLRADRGPHRRRPTELLADGGYPSHDAIEKASAASVTLYAPVPKPRNKASETPDHPPIDPPLPEPGKSDAVAAWRVRMRTDGAKQIYKQRAATAETVNADAKAHRGMAATALRGLDKVTGGACLFALPYNILRFITVSA